MYSIIEGRKEIAAALEMLERTLGRLCTPHERRWSFPGGGGSDVLPTYECDGQLTIGFSRRRRWNSKVPVLITVGPFVDGGSPTVECNIPCQGRNRRVNGCFALDETGRIWLCHRGGPLTVSPGRIPKRLVHRHFWKWLVKAWDVDRNSDVIPVAPLSDAELTFSLGQFAKSIRELKEQWVTASGKESELNELGGWWSELPSFPD
jgi:hypothetical protein